MIYLVSTQQSLFNSSIYEKMSREDSIEAMKSWDVVQFDTETDGKDCHINKVLCAQFGNDAADMQIVVDTTTINLAYYKDILESKRIILQNAKFDIKFLYNYGIVPRDVYDTMIVEQLLHLGWSRNPGKSNFISTSLKSIAERRLNIDIDKTVRSQIIWRGIDDTVIKYAAGDVMWLEKIMKLQLKECEEKGCIRAAMLENAFVPVISYMEWCGIKLDVQKWRQKMKKDLEGLEEAKKELERFVINEPRLKEFVYVDRQGDLFEGFNLKPKVNISWTSSPQVIRVAKLLGFDTKVQDKKTGEDKESVIEEHLKKQKGVCDEFLRLYFGKGEEGDEDYFPGHQGMQKQVTSFGQGHLNAINPNTGRIHTEYHQLGCDTGRMSCGSKQNNNDLARLKKLPVDPSPKQKKDGKGCPYPNMQQLPHDEFTRACFISEPDNLWVSCDYSAIESRLGADIYDEQSMKDEYLHGSGDIHSLCCWMVFNKECREAGCESIADIPKKAKHWRTKVKPIEFSQQFGGSEFAIQNAMGCSIEEAIAFKEAYAKGFPGIAEFKKKGAKSVIEKGYIMLCPLTGHKTFWWDYDKYVERKKTFTSEFWEDYRLNHKGRKGDKVAEMVSMHFKAESKWKDRKALNSPTQGCGAVILKHSQIKVFKWVIENGYFGKILLNNLTHDEANWEYPKEVNEFPELLKKTMEDTAAIYCKSLPIPADAAIGEHWIH